MILTNHPDKRANDRRVQRLSNADTTLADQLKEAADVGGDQVQAVLAEHNKKVADICLSVEFMLWSSTDNVDRAVTIANATNSKMVQQLVVRMLNEHGNRFEELLRDLPWDRK